MPKPPRRRTGASPRELEELIKNHYASLAFNVCKRQKVSVMENATPCQLLVDLKARPFAIHKAWPVQGHLHGSA